MTTVAGRIELADDSPPGWARVELTGTITADTAALLRNTARRLADRDCHVSVGLEGIESIDPAAVWAVLALGREQMRRGRLFDLTGLEGPMADAFRRAGVFLPSGV